MPHARLVTLARVLFLSGLLASVASGGGATPAPVRVAVADPGGVRLYVDGELSTERARDVPPEVDLLVLSLDRTAGGYEARLGFPSSFAQLRQFEGGDANHLVFVSLQPPRGPRLRVVLNPDGSGSADRARRGEFVPVEAVVPRIEGTDVVLPIPKSLEVGPDWEVQPHVLLIADDGGGLHDHGPQVPVGSLSGEGPARTYSTAQEGNVMEGGRPSWWKLTTPMPPGTRPASVHLEVRGGRIAAIVTMDGPPEPVDELDGRPVVSQSVDVVLQTAPLTGGTRHLIRFDVLDGTAEVLDVTDDPTVPPVVGQATVEVEGNDLVFDLGPAPEEGEAAGLGEAPGLRLVSVLGEPEIPEQAGPVDAEVTATSDEQGCDPGPFSFPVTMEIVNRILSIGHQDGDVSSGRIRGDGRVAVQSPGGRVYELDSVVGRRLTGTHFFQGCLYAVDFGLARPLVESGGEEEPPEAPPVARPAPPLSGDVFVGVDSLVLDANGDGMGIFSALGRADVLLPIVPIAPVEEGGISPLFIGLVAGGSAGGVALSIYLVRLLTNRDPCAGAGRRAAQAIASARKAKEELLAVKRELARTFVQGLVRLIDDEEGRERIVPEVRDTTAAQRHLAQAGQAYEEALVSLWNALAAANQALADLAACEGEPASELPADLRSIQLFPLLPRSQEAL